MNITPQKIEKLKKMKGELALKTIKSMDRVKNYETNEYGNLGAAIETIKQNQWYLMEKLIDILIEE